MNRHLRKATRLLPELAIAVVLIFAGAAIAVSGHSAARDSVGSILAAEGITQASYGLGVWGCAESDAVTFHFSGVRNGKAVKGAVCGGFLKGYTVRYFP